LQNVIERAVVLASDKVIRIEPHLLPVVSAAPPLATASVMPDITLAHSVTTNNVSLQSVEREHILAVLTQTNWVIEGERGAAKALNLHPNTLRSRLKKLGIQRPA
jgi:formate hydrogenlyase transcriptional activator